MCGISGFLHFDKERKASGHVIKRMSDSLSHRGPDGEGYYVKDNIALGHRRLSIIDLETGSQPMISDDGSVVLIFNGEIYNYIELKDELGRLGNKFKTSSDTEVIINSYKTWGRDCLNHFNGMWAFALWDEKKKELFLARDRVGEKPLYYAVFNGTFVFGSEIKSLACFGVPEEADLELLEIYLTLGYIPSPYSFFKNIKKLRPGHFLVVKDGSLDEKKYWELPAIDERNMIKNKDQVYENFDHLLTDSVKLRMRSDAPYGAFLSGGLDSSSIVAKMSQISSFPVETFTVGFKEKSFDERRLAAMVAKKFHTNHHEHITEPSSFDESLEKIAYYYDEPFGDTSAIPTGEISGYAAGSVKMVLTGDGGDEVLSGYTSYQGEKFASLYQKAPGFVRTGLPAFIKLLSRPVKGNYRYKLNRMSDILDSSSLSFTDRFISKSATTEKAMIKRIIGNQKVYPIEDFLLSFLSGCPYRDSFNKLMYLHLKLSLPDAMLVKVDRMSMAYSLETRTSFLDYRLIEYMARVHKSVKMNGFQRKSVLLKTAGQLLPAPILSAPKKGFGIPLREWFRREEFSERLKNLVQQIPFLNKDLLRQMILLNSTGERDFGDFLWILFVLNKKITG